MRAQAKTYLKELGKAVAELAKEILGAGPRTIAALINKIVYGQRREQKHEGLPCLDDFPSSLEEVKMQRDLYNEWHDKQSATTRTGGYVWSKDQWHVMKMRQSVQQLRFVWEQPGQSELQIRDVVGKLLHYAEHFQKTGAEPDTHTANQHGRGGHQRANRRADASVWPPEEPPSESNIGYRTLPNEFEDGVLDKLQKLHEEVKAYIGPPK
ncbi:unnamed protein product [Amoebophrya sp. A120]|nr:unnamed protein product [Amoebophrya sp. A120]|eukprot:GSA120T00019053001.1